jgi:endonuclease/exonuclease/phosphatase (EEP) superfamily protein YafD
MAMVLAAGALYNAALIAPLYTGDHPPASGDDRLVVVSMNTQLSNPNRQLPWILDQDPDVVLFLESSRIGEELLRELDTGYEVSSGIRNDRRFGVTVLTKEPIDLVLLQLAGAGGGAVRFEMTLEDRPVAVYGIHPPSPSNPWRSTARNEFMEEAGQVIAEEELPAIVVGDFNSTPWSKAFGLLTGPADLTNSQDGFGYSGTWPAHLPGLMRIPIDHLVYDDGLTVVDREVGPELDADHRPIRVVVAPAAETEAAGTP